MTDEQNVRLTNRMMAYDKRQKRGKYYNPNALAMYCRGLTHTRRHCENGADLRTALLNCFNDRLLDGLLKSVDLPVTTKWEALGSFEKLAELDDED